MAVSKVIRQVIWSGLQGMVKTGNQKLIMHPGPHVSLQQLLSLKVKYGSLAGRRIIISGIKAVLKMMSGILQTEKTGNLQQPMQAGHRGHIIRPPF